MIDLEDFAALEGRTDGMSCYREDLEAKGSVLKEVWGKQKGDRREE